MNIGIIGTGSMGSGLGKLWAQRGHKVLFGSREPDKAKALAESVGSNASSGTYADAAKFGEVVLLAVPWRGIEGSLQAAGSLNGKLLLDCTNPLSPDYMVLLVGHTSSGAEAIAKLAPGAKVVKAFNHIYAQIIHTSPQFGSQNADVLICGDDTTAKAKAAELIKDIGFNPIDSGALQNARLLEPFAELAVQLAYVQQLGTEQAFKLIRR